MGDSLNVFIDDIISRIMREVYRTTKEITIQNIEIQPYYKNSIMNCYTNYHPSNTLIHTICIDRIDHCVYSKNHKIRSHRRRRKDLPERFSIISFAHKRGLFDKCKDCDFTPEKSDFINITLEISSKLDKDSISEIIKESLLKVRKVIKIKMKGIRILNTKVDA